MSGVIRPDRLPSSSPSPNVSSESTSLSLSQRVANLGSSIFRYVSDSLSGSLARPLNLITAVIAYAGWKGVYNTSAEATKLITTSNALIGEGLYDQVQKVVEEHCSNFLVRNPSPFGSWNESCRNHLLTKLSSIVIDSEISPESKQQLIVQVQEDFLNLINDCFQRVAQDKDSGVLESLGVSREASLLEIKCCGSETHNHGKIPLKLVFSDGKEIIYKPRSMLPEAVLCSRDDSVFQEAGFGTYGIINQEDEKGKYGYSECLDNVREENTMESVEEVNQYMDRMVQLEKIGRELRLSDLHCENIITCKKEPKAIDLEVYLGPTDSLTPLSTGVFDINGAANTFDPLAGFLKDVEPGNQIWFDRSITQGKDVDFRYRMSEEDLRKIGVTIRNPDEVVFSQQMQDKITAAREVLQEHPGRFVLIETSHLKRMLPCLDPNDPQQEYLIIDIKRHLAQYGFTYNLELEPDIIKAIQEDILHNDVPIFYYNSITQEILYHNIVIGRKA